MSATASRRPYLLLLMAVVTLDQLTKWMVDRAMELHESRAIVPGLLSLTYVQNRGAAFGHEGKLDQHARFFNQRVRTGMDLAQRARSPLMRREAHHAALRARLEFKLGRLVRHGWSPWFRPIVQSGRLAAIGGTRKQQILAFGDGDARQAMRPAWANWINNLTS